VLEAFTEQGRERRRRRWVGLAVAVSIAFHVAALAAFLVGASWQIEKLDIAEPRVVLVAGLGSPAPAVEQAPPRPVPPRRRTAPVRRVTELAQPEETPRVTPPPEPPGDPASAAESGGLELFAGCSGTQDCVPAGLASLGQAVCGDGRLEPGEQCDDGGLVNRDGCSSRCTLERALMVDSRVIEGFRIAGDPQIHPPESVREAMNEDRKSRAIGIVRMCLSTSGAVESIRVVRSTGYALYDQLLTQRMRGWRYLPYRTASGTPVPACTAVTFIYHLPIRQVRRVLTR
jgi:cysteine-rich repeat protein